MRAKVLFVVAVLAISARVVCAQEMSGSVPLHFPNFYDPAKPLLNLQQAANATGNAQQWKNRAGVVVTWIDRDGILHCGGAGCGSGVAPVLSVYGRTGVVVAAPNDYNFNQLAGSLNLATQVSGILGDVHLNAYSGVGSCPPNQ